MDINEINEKLEEARSRIVKVKLIERKSVISGMFGALWNIAQYAISGTISTQEMTKRKLMNF